MLGIGVALAVKGERGEFPWDRVHAFARVHAQADSRPVTDIEAQVSSNQTTPSPSAEYAPRKGRFLRDLEDNLRKHLPEDLEILPDPHKIHAYKACRQNRGDT